MIYIGVLIDLSGMQFGNWFVLRRNGVNKNNQILWRCKCTCGSNIEKDILGQSLRRGSSKGCGKCNRGCKTENEYNLSGEYGVGYTSNTHKPFYFDLENYERIKGYLWRENDNGYCVAQRRKQNSRKYIRLHRMIMNAPSDKQVDHINHNTLDNRKANLRLVSNQENCLNKDVKGVYWESGKKKWTAHLTYDGIKHFKRFNNYEDAKTYRLYLENKYFKEYSYSNSQTNRKDLFPMMLLKNVHDVEAFLTAVNRCRDDVILRSCDGTEEFNLKSVLSRYMAIGELCKDHGDNYEIFCLNKADEEYMLEFFREIKETDKR